MAYSERRVHERSVSTIVFACLVEAYRLRISPSFSQQLNISAAGSLFADVYGRKVKCASQQYNNSRSASRSLEVSVRDRYGFANRPFITHHALEARILNDPLHPFA